MYLLEIIYIYLSYLLYRQYEKGEYIYVWKDISHTNRQNCLWLQHVKCRFRNITDEDIVFLPYAEGGQGPGRKHNRQKKTSAPCCNLYVLHVPYMEHRRISRILLSRTSEHRVCPQLLIHWDVLNQKISNQIQRRFSYYKELMG